MAELKVIVLAPDAEPRAVLEMQVDGTAVARSVNSFGAYPIAAADPLLRRINEAAPDVVVVDIPSQSAAAALLAIELLRADAPTRPVFAVGEMTQPQTIVSAMRSGAREFLQRPTSTTHLLEAFVRLTSAQRTARTTGERGKVFTVVNAKGGCGATTVAVNAALALQATQSHVALVDLASLGHAALHLNLRPAYTLVDALKNLHRLDASLLEGYMTSHPAGLAVLAGAREPMAPEVSTSDFARLFDLLVSHYRYVVVDASNRIDGATRVVCELSEKVLLVAQTDVPSLWSAARVQAFLAEGGSQERIGLVLNRFRKVPGFKEQEAEQAIRAKLFWKVPNQFPLVSAAIDRGIPVTSQNHNDIARSFVGLAAALLPAEAAPKRKSWLLFGT